MTDVIENCKGVFVPTSKAELYDMVFGPEHADVYDVVFDVPGKGKIKEADALVERLKTQFGDRLYIELQRAGRRNDELATAHSANFAVRHGLPVVATHPIQFLNKEDFEAHEVRCAIAEGLRCRTRAASSAIRPSST